MQGITFPHSSVSITELGVGQLRVFFGVLYFPESTHSDRSSSREEVRGGLNRVV